MRLSPPAFFILGVASALSGALVAQQTAPASSAADVGADGFDLSKLPTVVATVDGIPITKAALIQEAQGAYRQLGQRGIERPLDRAFYSEALDQLVAGILLHAEALNLGIAATLEELDLEVESVRARFPSPEDFLRSLAAEGSSEQKLRAEIAQQASIERILQSQIRPSILLDEADVRAFYDQNRDQLKMPERVRVRHILIQVRVGSSDLELDTARSRIDALLERARQGEDFASIAREASEDESKGQGGELPWILRGQTIPDFERASFELDPGEISDVVQSPVGFHIIQGIEHAEPRIATFDEARQQIEAVLAEPMMRTALRERVQGLKAQATIERFFP